MGGHIRYGQDKEKPGIPKTKKKSRETTGVDSARPLTGRDIISVQSKLQNADIAKEEATMRNCADRQDKCNMWKEQRHRQKKTTEITTEFRK